MEEPSELVVESLDTEMPETIIAECLVVAEAEGAGVEMVGAGGVEMVAEVEGETVEEAVAVVVEMEEVEVDVRKDSHIQENVEMICLKLRKIKKKKYKITSLT